MIDIVINNTCYTETMEVQKLSQRFLPFFQCDDAYRFIYNTKSFALFTVNRYPLLGVIIEKFE